MNLTSLHDPSIPLGEALITRSRSVDMHVSATADVCQPLVDYLVERFHCQLAEVWSYDPRSHQLVLVSQAPHHPYLPNRVDVLSSHESLTGFTMEAKRIVAYSDLVKPQAKGRDAEGRRFQDQQLRESLNLQEMWSIPLLNTANNHQPLGALNIFPEVEYLEFVRPKYGVGVISPPESTALKRLARVTAASIEGNLRDRCYRMSMMLSQDLAEHSQSAPLTLQPACARLAACCVEAIQARVVSVYLFDVIRDKLRHQASAIHIPPNTVRTNLDELTVSGPVRGVFENHRETVLPRLEPHHMGHYEDGVAQIGESCILVPIHDLSGKIQGVIRCLRSTKSQGVVPRRFTYDEVAIVEAMCQAFIPHLESLLEAEQRRFALQKLAHEMRVPVTAFTAMLAKMRQECHGKFRFQYPHFKEGEIYTDMMSRLMKELDIRRFGPSEIPLRKRPTKIETEVIIPAKRFTIPLLRERGFSTLQVSHKGFADNFPRLYIDPGLISQVVFNLLDNAVKFFNSPNRPAAEFRCEVEGRVTKDSRRNNLSKWDC